MRRGLIALLISLALGCVLFLWIARTQARAMFRFVDAQGAERTARPEHLSLFEKTGVILGGVTVPRPENTSDPKATHGLDFETHQLANDRGDTLEYWTIPGESRDSSAPLVLLFHGYAASKESLLPCAAEFRRLGCECWLVDFFGSGGSTGNHTTFGWYEANDVRCCRAIRSLFRSRRKSGSPDSALWDVDGWIGDHAGAGRTGYACAWSNRRKRVSQSAPALSPSAFDS